MSVQDDYRAKHPKSLALAERARKAIPGGITHDIRHLVPFPIYVERAPGQPQVGRRRPRVRRLLDGPRRAPAGPLPSGGGRGGAASRWRAAPTTGACHELEVRWAELVNAADPVRRADALHHRRAPRRRMMAMRLARAFTGRPEDRSSSPATSTAGTTPSWPPSTRRTRCRVSAGVPTATLDQVVIVPAQRPRGGRARLRATATSPPSILEPTGGQLGATPTIPGYPGRAARADHARTACC